MEHQPPLRWTNIPSDGSLTSFAKRNQLDPRKLVLEKGLLILPRNAELQPGTINIDVFPSTTKELLATFNERGLEVELYGQGNIRRELIQKSADILLPILLFAGSAAVSVGLNIVSSWIYDRWVKKDGPLPSIRAEYAELGAGSRVVRWRRIEGPADQVCRLLQEESQALPASANSLASDAEADEAWWTEHCLSQANAALTVARELASEAERHVREGNDKFAERLLRRALVKLREAVLWEPHRIEHRLHLHSLGQRIHDRFGCELEYRDGSY